MKSWIMFLCVIGFNFLCLMFLSSWTPLLSALCIVLMSLNIFFIMVYLTYTSWFAYIMFLIFLGGLMVLFTYMCSIAPNEFTKPEIMKKMLYATVYSLFIMSIVDWPVHYSNFMAVKHIQFMMYSFNVSLLLISIIYLLLTLIVTVDISSYKYGPVRAKKS